MCFRCIIIFVVDIIRFFTSQNYPSIAVFSRMLKYFKTILVFQILFFKATSISAVPNLWVAKVLRGGVGKDFLKTYILQQQCNPATNYLFFVGGEGVDKTYKTVLKDRDLKKKVGNYWSMSNFKFAQISLTVFTMFEKKTYDNCLS
jgi:hypothetical protein